MVFPGSNCDRDMMHVLRDVCGIDAQFFWHEKPLPKSGLDALVYLEDSPMVIGCGLE